MGGCSTAVIFLLGIFLLENILFAVYIFFKSTDTVYSTRLIHPKPKPWTTDHFYHAERMRNHTVLSKYFKETEEVVESIVIVNDGECADFKLTQFYYTVLRQVINLKVLNENAAFKRFYMKEEKKKKNVTILLIVTSAPKRSERRQAIRDTWWNDCIKTKKVKPACIFITDYQGPNDKYFHQVRVERLKYNDVHFQLVKSGVKFGDRFINHMLFAVNNYDFDYFLRVDDDFFVCLKKLLLELPAAPPLPMLHWGWVHHKVPDSIKRPEESIILLSYDLVAKFLVQDPQRILCHPLADQMIAIWLTQLNIKDVLRHDGRIHHDPPVSEIKSIMQSKDICVRHIALHGSYNNNSRTLWENRGDEEKTSGTLKTNSIHVHINGPYAWNGYHNPVWEYEPKLCASDPTWDTSRLQKPGTSYTGRQGS